MVCHTVALFSVARSNFCAYMFSKKKRKTREILLGLLAAGVRRKVRNKSAFKLKVLHSSIDMLYSFFSAVEEPN